MSRGCLSSFRSVRVGAHWLGVFLLTAACAEGGGSVNPTPPPSTPLPPSPPPVASITLEPAADTLIPRQARTLRAVLRDAAGATLTGRTISWSSSNITAAEVSAAGEVTALSAGTAIITAVSEGRSAQSTIVIQPTPVALISLSAPRDTLIVGDTARLLAVARSADSAPLIDREIRWRSENDTIASVTSAGLVRALSPGATSIVAASEGRSASVRVIVRPVPVASVEIAPAIDTLEIAETRRLDVTLRSADGRVLTDRTVEWSTSDDRIVAISDSGHITAVSAGRAVITARSEAQEATADIIVRSAPVRFTALSVGFNHNCVLDADGRAWCWGEARRGVLGDGGSTVSGFAAQPRRVAGDRVFANISANLYNTCAVDLLGAAWCWGDNQNGELGVDTITAATSTPSRVAGDVRFSVVRVGNGHNCGLSVDGLAFCWGVNVFGALGSGDALPRLRPHPVSGGLTFVQLSVGNGYACAVTAANAGYCWGLGQEGQRGDGTTRATQQTPTLVAGMHPFTRIEATGGIGLSTCGLTTTAAAFCWGRNSEGQLGLGFTGGRLSPNAVVDNHRFRVVRAGWGHSCGIDLDGRAWCWGFGSSGQLGHGLESSSTRPVRVVGEHAYVDIGTGRTHTCGLTTQGRVLCWGGGTLGGGTSVPRELAPVRP